MNRILSLIALALLATLVAVEVGAQQQEQSFPLERVRFTRTENHMPTRLYVNHRVLFNNVALEADGDGMRIRGGIITDFEADSIPSGSELPRGQLQVRINIELYQINARLERRGGVVQFPRITSHTPRVPIETLMTTVTATQRIDRFGYARFELPRLDRPLAPGIYHLRARVSFLDQPLPVREAIRWCSDWFGVEVVTERTVNPLTLEEEYKSTDVRIMSDPKLHEEWYESLLSMQHLDAVTTIYVGDVLQENNTVRLAEPRPAETRPTYMLWTSHFGLLEELLLYESQIEGLDQDLENKLSRAATPEERRRHQEETRSLKLQVEDSIATLGGRPSRDELNLYRTHLAARGTLLEQIRRFEDYLTRQYWILTDGHLFYGGWRRVLTPGRNAWFACLNNDNRSQPAERRKNLREAEQAEGGLEARWQRRRDQWVGVPSDIRTVAFAFLRSREQTAEWDADSFTVAQDGEVRLNIEKWQEYRAKFIEEFTESTRAIFDEIRTTNQYYNQVWPQAFADAEAARDAVFTLAYSFEYLIRTDRHKEEREAILRDWSAEARQYRDLNLGRYFIRAQAAPATVETTFNAHMERIKSAIWLRDFAAEYRRAIEAGTLGRDLPGASRR